MSISAEYDTVASSDEIMESKKRLPEQTRFEVISGGNHAGFGDYGPQSGDGEAAISKQQQWQRTAELFTQWLQQWE
jgi:dienelactone hydrolase